MLAADYAPPSQNQQFRVPASSLRNGGRAGTKFEKTTKKENLLVPYHNKLKKLIEQGYVVRADESFEGKFIYVFHHPVVRSDKATSKIRPVFDGAAKTKSTPSLNGCLETGPNLNPDMLEVLLRFRSFKYAWMADIEQAFLNIELTPDDGELILFLWFKDPDSDEIFRYRFCINHS